MVVGILLERVRGSQNGFLIKRLSHDLKADWESLMKAASQ
jgi:hypothetical protein